MRTRKTQIIGAVVVMLASSLIGTTVLRAPDGRASVTLDALPPVPEPASAVAQIDVTQPVLNGGTGESLVLVIAAQVPSSEVASQLSHINAEFGELQGFSHDASQHYELTGLYLPDGPDSVDVPCTDAVGCPEGMVTARELQPIRLRHMPLADEMTRSDGTFRLVEGHTLIVSGFRTKAGAEEFLELARALGVRDLVTVQARKLGGGDIGLGQEPHPDGSGPLLGTLGDQEAFQR